MCENARDACGQTLKPTPVQLKKSGRALPKRLARGGEPRQRWQCAHSRVAGLPVSLHRSAWQTSSRYARDKLGMRSVDVSHWGLLCRFGQHDRHGAFPILSPSNLAEVCTAFTLLGLGQRVVIYKDLFQACDFACGLVPCDFLSHRAFRTIMDICMFRSSNLSRCGKRLNTADSSFKFQRVEMFETVNLSGSSSHPWSKPRLVSIFRLLF